MAKRVIEEATLIGLADSLREVTGKNRKFTPEEMMTEVKHILDSLTYILVDENGTEVPAVFLENEVVFDATANDIRLGKVAVTGDGVTEGTKEIPAYHTTEGFALIPPGSAMKIKLSGDKYMYTKLQALICEFNSTIDNSVATTMVSIDDKVYNVSSVDMVSSVKIDGDNNSIDLGLTNESSALRIIRYFTYKEE